MLGKRLPPLSVGEWIQGSQKDVGPWGDGKVYVLDLWGTWCQPCIANIPMLTRIQATYRDRGLVVIGYSWEKPKVVRDFVKKMGERMRYIVVSDPGEVTLGRLTELEAVTSFPYAFLVDRTGKVVWAGHPEDDHLVGAVEQFFATDSKGGRQSNHKEKSGGARASSLVARAQEFQWRLERADYEGARALMAKNARRWWEKRDGEGQPWRIGPDARGPWAGWDEHFRSTKEVVRWDEKSRSATALIRETNDYFRLLERGWVSTEVTYFFDDLEQIEGLLIAAAGERPPGRTDAFLAWARAHAPEELSALMPGGEIDPGGDHPERVRGLLSRWRAAAGLPAIGD